MIRRYHHNNRTDRPWTLQSVDLGSFKLDFCLEGWMSANSTFLFSQTKTEWNCFSLIGGLFWQIENVHLYTNTERLFYSSKKSFADSSKISNIYFFKCRNPLHFRFEKNPSNFKLELPKKIQCEQTELWPIWNFVLF